MLQNRLCINITFTKRTNGQVFKKDSPVLGVGVLGGGALTLFPTLTYFIYCVTFPFYKRYTALTDGMNRGQGTELDMVEEEHARSNLKCYLTMGLQ